MKETILYISLSPDVEIRLSLQARFFNGIDSDPRTLTREPSLSEIFQLSHILKNHPLPTCSSRPSLDYPMA